MINLIMLTTINPHVFSPTPLLAFLNSPMPKRTSQKVFSWITFVIQSVSGVVALPYPAAGGDAPWEGAELDLSASRRHPRAVTRSDRGVTGSVYHPLSR